MKEIFQIASAIVFSIGGAAVVLFGLSNWLGQLWLKRVMANEQKKIDDKLQTAQHNYDMLLASFNEFASRRSFAFTKQYEKEFSVYEKLWEQIVELYSAALSLRPELDAYPADESPEHRKRKRLARYYEALHAVRSIILNNKPFYNEVAYEITQRLSFLCSKERSGYEHRNPDEQGQEYWEDASKNREAIIKIVDDLCDAIRCRIRNVENATVQS